MADFGRTLLGDKQTQSHMCADKLLVHVCDAIQTLLYIQMFHCIVLRMGTLGNELESSCDSMILLSIELVTLIIIIKCFDQNESVCSSLGEIFYNSLSIISQNKIIWYNKYNIKLTHGEAWDKPHPWPSVEPTPDTDACTHVGCTVEVRPDVWDKWIMHLSARTAGLCGFVYWRTYSWTEN